MSDVNEQHWCQCDPCTQERVDQSKYIAELEAKLEALQKVSDRWQKDCRWYQEEYADCATELKEAKATIATQAAAIEALQAKYEHAYNALLAEQNRVEELKGLLERGYSLVKPPPVQERFKNIVGKARAAWLTDVLEVLTQETKDGN